MTETDAKQKDDQAESLQVKKVRVNLTFGENRTKSNGYFETSKCRVMCTGLSDESFRDLREIAEAGGAPYIELGLPAATELARNISGEINMVLTVSEGSSSDLLDGAVKIKGVANNRVRFVFQ